MRSGFVGIVVTHRTSAGRADGPGSATRVRRMAVGSGRSVPRAGGPRRPGIAVIRTGETMMRAVAVFVGREVRGAAPVTTGRRPEAADSAFGGLSPGGAIR